MKRILSAAMLIMVASSASYAARGYIYINHDGERTRTANFEFDGMLVCNLKRMVASTVGLSMSEFDLKKGGVRLDASKSLKEAFVSSGNNVQVAKVRRSNQCT
ncbi:hypothetical protein [Kordiimonas aquimaris]|uniref:hypothetical protein n=1 Tax=Kordiimonas aquimaris TaxID=707591 RepID=UPI0021D228B0|nr:hypothetical protein [Kordiimonas aquimaris]